MTPTGKPAPNCTRSKSLSATLQTESKLHASAAAKQSPNTLVVKFGGLRVKDSVGRAAPLAAKETANRTREVALPRGSVAGQLMDRPNESGKAHDKPGSVYVLAMGGLQ